MTPLRLGLLATCCLTLSFAAGWWSHRPPSSGVMPVAPKAGSPASQASSAAANTPITPDKTTRVQSLPNSVIERLARLRWLKNNGISTRISLFNNDGLEPQFALVYGLTPAEFTQLTQVYQQAKKSLDGLAKQHAQLDPASTDSKLIVTVPAFPAEGGAIYNSLLTAFTAVLGPDRYAFFNDLSGDDLESSLDGFGTGTSRYEISLTKADPPHQMYVVGRFISIPSLTNSGSGSSNISEADAAGITKLFPFLNPCPLPTTPTVDSTITWKASPPLMPASPPR